MGAARARPVSERDGGAVRLAKVPDPGPSSPRWRNSRYEPSGGGHRGDVDVAAIRRKLGLRQEEFAARFGFDWRTVPNREQGRNRPDGPTRALPALIERDPAAVAAELSA